MQIYDFIGINKQSIIGIKNPVLTIEGICNKENATFIVMADGDEIPFELYKLKEENSFGLRAPLNVYSKYIKAYVIDGDRRLLIFTSKMNVFNRIGLKIEIMTSELYDKFKVLPGVIKYSFLYAWDKHRLLVPFKYWKDYVRRFRKMVHERVEKLNKEKEE